jgi:hypothetical protein
MKLFFNKTKIDSGGQADIYKVNVSSTREQLVLKVYKKKGKICLNEFNIVSLLQNYPYIVDLIQLDSLPSSMNDTIIPFKYYKNHSVFE